MLLEVLCKCECIVAVSLSSQTQRLQANQQLECSERVERRPKITENLPCLSQYISTIIRRLHTSTRSLTA